MAKFFSQLKNFLRQCCIIKKYYKIDFVTQICTADITKMLRQKIYIYIRCSITAHDDYTTGCRTMINMHIIQT